MKLVVFHEILIFLSFFHLINCYSTSKTYLQNANKNFKLCRSTNFKDTTIVLVNLDNVRIGVFNKTNIIHNLWDKYDHLKNEIVTMTMESDGFCISSNNPNWWAGKSIDYQATDGQFGMSLFSEKNEIVLYDSPKITFTEGFLRVLDGEETKINCSASGNPNVRIELQSEISEIGSITNESQTTENNEIIAFVESKTFVINRSHHKKTIKCIAIVNISGNEIKEEKSAEIDVQYVPTISFESSVIHSDTGESVKVKVNVAGNPRAKFTCSLLNVDEKRELTFEEENIESTDYEVVIKYDKLAKKDTGNYTCTATNERGFDQKEFFLTLGPINVRLTDNANEVKCCDSHEFEIIVDSMSPINASTVIVNVTTTTTTTTNDIFTNETQPIEIIFLNQTLEENKWTRKIRVEINNLSENKEYRVVVRQLCNAHQCWINESLDDTNIMNITILSCTEMNSKCKSPEMKEASRVKEADDCCLGVKTSQTMWIISSSLLLVYTSMQYLCGL